MWPPESTAASVVNPNSPGPLPYVPPSVLSIGEYRDLLSKTGFEVLAAEDTHRFARYVDLYIHMLQMQLTYDALQIIGFDGERMESLAGEMAFMQKLAHEGKIAQGVFVARRKPRVV